MAEENIILNIRLNDKEIDDATNAAAKARAEIDKLRKANRELAKAEGDNSLQIQKNNLEIKKYSGTLRDNERVLVANDKATRASGGSIEQLRSQLSIVSQQWAKLSEEERTNTEAGKALSKQKLDLTEKLKAEEKATGDTRRNVGNYSEGVKEAIQGSGLFGRQLGQLQKAQKAYQVASASATKSTKAFRLALIATGIGAIVVAVGSLVAAFASTQKGVDAVNKALAPLKAVFQGLIGIAQDLSLQLFDAFKNPKQAVSDLWDAIKKNIVNRITAVPTLFKSVFDTIAASFSFLGNSIKSIVADIPIIGKGIDKAAAKKNADEAADVLKQSIKETGQALIQLNTGLDKEQQKSLVNFAKAQGDRISIAAETGKKIAELQIQIEKTEIDLTKRRAELNAEFERSKEIAQDDTKTEEERRAAAQRAIEAQNELLKQEQDFLDLRIEKKKLENSLNDTDREAKKELAQLEAERTQAEALASRKRVSARNLLETIDKQIDADRLAALKEKQSAELEAAKQEEDLQRLAEERELLRIEQEKTRLAEERAEGLISKQEYEDSLLQIELDNLTKTREAAELARQEAIESTELTELEKQRIILESEKIIADARKKTAQISIDAQKETTDVVEETEGIKKGSSLDAAKDIAQLTEGLAAENTATAKAAGIAQVGISTTTAAAAALSPVTGLGPIAGIPLAALVVAKGLASAAKIAGIGFADGGYTGQGYGSPDESGHRQAGIVHDGEYVVKKSMVNNPSIAPIVSQLEGMRLRGYADGGFVGRTASQGTLNGFDIESLRQAIQNMPSPIVEVSAINQAAQQRNKVRVESSLG